jgi:flagellar hook-associated protein 2
MTINLSSINLINGGLDVQSIVDSLVSASPQQTSITQLQQQNTNSQNEITAYQTLNTDLLALKTSVESLLYQGETVPLTPPSSFTDRFNGSVLAARKATSSNENVVTATAASGMATGSYTVNISHLATFDSFTSNNFASDTDTQTKTGSLVIQKGTNAPVTITIDDTNNTLQGIEGAINDANAGFTASILNDGSSNPYRLVITSNDSGTANALQITPHLTGGSGASLSFDETTLPKDAALQVNNIDITSSSNTVTNAIQGVTFNLQADSGTAVVTVNRDIDSIVSAFQDFVTKYNAAVSYISSQSTYNTTTSSAGILSGDFTLREAQTDIVSPLTRSINLSGSSLNVLSQLGFSLADDGTLSLDANTLQNELSTNFNGTAQLLLADGQDSDGNTVSFLPMLETQLQNLTDPLEGPIYLAENATQKNISSVNDKITQLQQNLATQQDLWTQQYTQANQALEQLMVLESSVNNQMSTISSSWQTL